MPNSRLSRILFYRLRDYRTNVVRRRVPIQWSTFLEAHWGGAVCAADFFTVEVFTRLDLSRRHVLFVMDLETRAIEIVGIVAEPYEQWVMNMVRGLLNRVISNGRTKVSAIG